MDENSCQQTSHVWEQSEPQFEDSEKITSLSLDSLQDDSNFSQKIKIFLRMRPLVGKFYLNSENPNEIFTIINSTSIITKIPISDSLSKSSKHPHNLDTQNLRKYKFTEILNTEISQSQVFTQVAEQSVLEFIEGQSSTLMSYGTSSSGKSYSFFGSDNFLGIIPNTIKFLFSNIKCAKSAIFKPGNGNFVCPLDKVDKVSNIIAKEQILTSKRIEKLQDLDLFLKLGDLPLKEEGCFHSVWLSFIEIYNEGIYDLLDEEGKNKQLKLVTDKTGNSYVKGVRKIFAANGAEAFQIMMSGKSRLRVADTFLNPKSSRSHAIFSMTLLKYGKNFKPEDVIISTLTFCDLAGSGGLRKTKDELRIKESRSINASLLVLGRCLKSVQENLTSRNNSEVSGPFRESNLTRYLQKTLTGKENLIILVNINRSPELYLETQNVLNFVSIINKMISDSLKSQRKLVSSRGLSQTSTMVSSPNVSSCATPVKNIEKLKEEMHKNMEEMKNEKESKKNEEIEKESCKKEDTPEGTQGKSTEELEEENDEINQESKEENKDKNYEKLKKENDALLQELSSLKSVISTKEHKIRQELDDLYSVKIKDLEEVWRKRNEELDTEREDLLKFSVKQVEDFYKERINNITNRKRKRLSSHEGHGDFEQTTIESLEAENAKATSKIISLREAIEKLKKKNVDLSIRKSELVFELSITKKELEDLKIKNQNESVDENSANGRRESVLFEFTEQWLKTSELRDQLDERNEEIEKLKAHLEDREQEICEIREKLQKVENCVLENSRNDESIDEISKKDEIFNLAVPSSTSSPNSFYKIPISENSLFDEKSPSVCLKTLVRVPVLEPLDLPEDTKLSFLESSYEKSDKSVLENDSGIRTSSESRRTSDFKTESEDKSIQVDFNLEEDLEKIKSSLVSLKFEFETLKDDYSDKSSRIENLVQETEVFKNVISELEVDSVSNRKKVEEYEFLLASKDQDLERLNLDKKQLETKYNDTCKLWKEKVREYEEKVEKLNLIKEKFFVSNEFENSVKNCVDLSNRVKIAQDQLEEKVLRCSTEHVPKIIKLEEELVDKNKMIYNLHAKVSETTMSLGRLQLLDEKIKNFEKLIQRGQEEKEDLRNQLQERTLQQKNMESELINLTKKIAERDSEMLSLQESFNSAISTNAVNYKNNSELNKKISDLLLKISEVKSELLKSEEARKSLDRCWAQEYGFLRSQLSTFENQGNLMTMMYEKNEDMLTETEKLKIDLDMKNRQIQEIKKSHGDTIQRYDSLVDQLQMDVDEIKNSKQYLAEPTKLLKKSISETFKFKKGKSKMEERSSVNPKANSKFWSSQTIDSSASLESISQVPKQSSQCSKIKNEKDNHQVESEVVMNIISSKLLGYYNNIDTQSGTTLIRIVDNRHSL